MRIYSPLLLCLCIALLIPGCEDKPETAKQEDESDPVETPQGPVIPEAGVIVIQINMHHAHTNAFVPENPPPANDAAWVETIGNGLAILLTDQFEALGPPETSGISFRCEQMGTTGRVAFWIERNDTIDEEAAIALADALGTALIENINRAFDAGWANELDALQAELDVVLPLREEAQQATRRFREARRGLDDTPESRREWAHLDHTMNARNTEAGELQKQMREIHALRERGQRMFRRLNR